VMTTPKIATKAAFARSYPWELCGLMVAGGDGPRRVTGESSRLISSGSAGGRNGGGTVSGAVDSAAAGWLSLAMKYLASFSRIIVMTTPRIATNAAFTRSYQREFCGILEAGGARGDGAQYTFILVIEEAGRVDMSICWMLSCK
jgi:hypothetical protein